MEELIRRKLKKIEEAYRVRILFALESGSRAWGFETASSDYDVRFIYIHPPEWYLSIDPQGVGSKKDVIAYPIEKGLDIFGWEITKALRLFRKSNPTILEWLGSHPIYIQDHVFVNQLLAFEKDVFNPIPIRHHYFNLAMGNHKKHFLGVEVKIKIYLYVIKSLLACVWIEKNKSFPPVRIQDLLLLLEDEDEFIKREVEQLIEIKKLGGERTFISLYPAINHYIENQFSSIQQSLSPQKASSNDGMKQLDQLFRDTLFAVWNLK